MIKNILIFLLTVAGFTAGAQDTAPQMADGFRADGKIYVVISVIALIFLAIVFFLVYLERKVKKLEDQVNNTKTGH